MGLPPGAQKMVANPNYPCNIIGGYIVGICSRFSNRIIYLYPFLVWKTNKKNMKRYWA